MAHINTAKLVSQVAYYGGRANAVRQDPAVIKTGKVAGRDIAQARGSVSAFIREAVEAWKRSA